jgi:hypothetical protein
MKGAMLIRGSGNVRLCDFFCILSLFLKKSRNEPSWNLFLRSGPLRSRQFDWCDSWRSCASAHGVTHGPGACRATDAAPRRPHSRKTASHDLVAPTAVARPMPHSPCASWASVAPEQTTRLSHASLLSATKLKLKPPSASSSSLSFSLPLFSPEGWSAPPSSSPAAVVHPHSYWSSFLVVSQGSSPFLTEYICIFRIVWSRLWIRKFLRKLFV